ncbi:hypothetical protein KHQ06_16245 [Nocardia tengchongensis]|uniref:Secreted protein n=1 Tax=Nocardia tengchongensis TaxID=2055889 RepID=A0ABX8CWA1_9NOCA|nr:hypothetical protein [Nocardia tengchongensis]QVI24183.1 hypothetical protein KHQ06_16245 [Nocardia tengchongensis]
MVATHARIAARAVLAATVVGTASFGLFGSLTVANAGGDYGPDTCQEGYVWREANAADHVCVSPGTRDQARADNAAAASRRAGGGAYGPNTCVNGFVWREAYTGDVVCVTTAGASFGYQTTMWDPKSGFHEACTGGDDSYIQAYDPNSQRWSERLPFKHDCH